MNHSIAHLVAYGGPSLGSPSLNGRFANRLHQGFLQGCNDSQFNQAAGKTLPILPATINSDLYARLAAARGDTAGGVPLMPGWQQSHSFNPGKGMDAYASGITHTAGYAGLTTVTGLWAPVISSGVNYTTDGPQPLPWSSSNVGLGSLLTAPVVRADGPTRARPTAAMQLDPGRTPVAGKPAPKEVRVVK